MTPGLVVFARADSRRLPGKVLRDVAGRPLLGRVLDRLRHVPGTPPVIVATSDRPVDDAVAAFAGGEGVAVFRGAGDDVLGRARACAAAHGLDPLVRISGDSPFLPGALVGRVLALFGDARPDVATNVFPRGFPPGASVEALSVAVLGRLDAEVRDAADREHVTTFVYRHPDRFTITNLGAADPSWASVRLTVDTEEEWRRADWIAAHLGAAAESADLEAVVSLARRCPL